MIITADIAMYPLDEGYSAPIITFIHTLRRQPGVEVVTHQMSTQVRGEYDAVTQAINQCMKPHMQGPATVVFVVRYLNADLDISMRPDIG
ncbi:hypothetical protein F3N42_11975 [Marinihelvus fidelis]|uniref:Thiamine-binding protein domain-containing protein n=1 Tax=Marinihelvus fidelis TaxID=2613842 RepID=A0A5N0T5T4_9GAMM|nr:thiamine-binding protein [Marinihelvus fidelis]KAA9130420.1 hypothetical protein F3N42_11975 [Marinihelvus fidelis]